MSFVIGVDVGGTTSTICIGNLEREVLMVSDQFETRNVDGPQASVDSIVKNSKACMEKLGLDVADLAGVGLATPGPATRDGVLLKSKKRKRLVFFVSTTSVVQW